LAAAVLQVEAVALAAEVAAEAFSIRLASSVVALAAEVAF
jgi:hypothetical protein